MGLWNTKIWYRYFFFRFFFLVLSLTMLTFSLFVLADILTHIKDIFDETTTWKTWGTYYLCLLFYRLDVLIPFSIATATTLLLPRLLRNNEFIPLMNSGLSLTQILKPFVAVTILASGILWLNEQCVYPKVIARYHEIVKSDFGREALPSDPIRLGTVFLKGGSRLFFNVHNPKARCIDDVFWVRSADCAIHIEKLYYFTDRIPEGHGVDVIERDQKGTMVKTASYPFCELSELQFNQETLRIASTDPKELSIFQLAALATHSGSSQSLRSTENTLALLLKLLSPLLAWLAFLFPAPLCLRFEHRIPQAILVFLSLAALFCFHLIMHATMVLGRAPFFGSTIIVILPWALALFFTFRKARSLS